MDTRIQPAAKTLLSLARKLPLQGTQVPDALQSTLEKLRPANYPQIHKHHAVWYPSLPVLLIAWVARGSQISSRPTLKMTLRSQRPTKARRCKHKGSISPRVVGVVEGGHTLTKRSSPWAATSNGLLSPTPCPNLCVRGC